MKNLLIASAVLAMLATPSLALDLGKGFAFDNDIKASYLVDAQEFAASDKLELNYHVNTDTKVYLDSTLDLQDIKFNGANLGVEYVPTAFNKVTLNAEAQFDENLHYNDVLVYAELKF